MVGTYSSAAEFFQTVREKDYLVRNKVQQFNFRNGPVKQSLLTFALAAAVAFEVLSL
jgi:hypothetical protein